MGLTISFHREKPERIGRKMGIMTGSITFDDSYADGGESVALIARKFRNLRDIVCAGRSAEADQYYGVQFVKATNKLKVYAPMNAIANHQHAAITAGTPSGTNAESSVSPYYEGPDMNGITKPVIALTHNADPVSNLAAAALYAIEGYGASQANVIALQSTTNGNADVSGETANGSTYGVAASCRFFVKDSDTPAGVQIYVNEGESDRLEFVSPTETDGYIVMPFESAAGGVPAAIRVLVHHSASAGDGKPLYFDDNGAADAQLCFVDTGGVGGVIPAADIAVLTGFYGYQVSGNMGVAGAQTFSGAEMATHQHAAAGAVAQGSADEVTAATNLSTLEVVFMAIGDI